MIELSAPQSSIDSSRIFRTILDAMAKPGHVMPLPQRHAPAPLLGTCAAIIQTLCDFQSPICLGEGLASPEIIRFIKFHTGAPVTDSPAAASFAVLQASMIMLNLSSFSQGTHEYPDRSTTLILQVDGFNATDVELSGPGLIAPSRFGARDLTRDFWQQMIANAQHYPLGVDIIFANANAIACCPRSTLIELKELR